MEVDVISLGAVEREGCPKIYYPPGRYEVDDVVAADLRAQGVLAPEPAPAVADAPASEDAAGGGRKGKGA